MKEAPKRRLSDILGTVADPSLQLIGVTLDDEFVRIRLLGHDGPQVLYYCAEQACRVVSELVVWSDQRKGSDARGSFSMHREVS